MLSYLKKRLEEITEEDDNFISNSANFIALLFSSLPYINWAGFYFRKGNVLLLGPFQGKIACMKIPLGKGVCGFALEKCKAIIVDDVHKFPGHIACDPDSKSEIVIPLIFDDKVFGVLDIDSPIINRFSTEDQLLLESLLDILIKKSNTMAIINYYAS